MVGEVDAARQQGARSQAGSRLVLSEIACRRGGRLLFEGLSFTVDAGGAALLTGANGAGKTSLLLIVAGLLRSEAGEARLEGPAGAVESLAEAAHLVGHRDGLKSQLTVAENLGFVQALFDAPRQPLGPALDAVGLAHLADTPVAYLSAGQRKRAALARLLVAPRPLWLLDEPATALDAAARAMLATLMGEHLARGGMILAATHEPIGIAAPRIRIGP
jgi:heme exporter protein A